MKKLLSILSAVFVAVTALAQQALGPGDRKSVV